MNKTPEQWADFYKFEADENGPKLDDVFGMAMKQARNELLDDMELLIDLRIIDNVSKGQLPDGAIIDELHFVKRRISARRQNGGPKKEIE